MCGESVLSGGGSGGEVGDVGFERGEDYSQIYHDLLVCLEDIVEFHSSSIFEIQVASSSNWCQAHGISLLLTILRRLYLEQSAAYFERCRSCWKKLASLILVDYCTTQ